MKGCEAMSEYDNRNQNQNDDEIELVDFSRNREIDAIRKNEALEREKRRKRVAAMRRQERIRRQKQERLKQMLMAWGMLLLVVVAVVAIIIGVVRMCAKDEPSKEKQAVGDTVSESEKNTVDGFMADYNGIYGKDSEIYNEVLKSLPAVQGEIKDLSMLYVLSDSFLWTDGTPYDDAVRETVKNCPIYDAKKTGEYGYIWTENDSMYSTLFSGGTKVYFYDTNASFICAAADICIAENSTGFLESVDTTKASASGDYSENKTVGKKLEMAVNYFFADRDDGIVYDKETGLAVIKQSAHNGKGTGQDRGYPSNMFFNYPFGHYDLYCNLLFNNAMQKYSILCDMQNDSEGAEKYGKIAEDNKKAINEYFWDNGKGRYIGCIDEDGNKHDNGFTAINLMAISVGAADEEKTKKIFSWIDGERTVEGDTATGEEIYKNEYAPVFSTVGADDLWWTSVEGKYATTNSFGVNWQNGAPALISAYFDIEASQKAGRTDRLKKQSNAVIKAADKKQFDYAESHGAEMPYLKASATANAVKSLAGVDVVDNHLVIKTEMSKKNTIGVKVMFDEQKYGVLYDGEKVYVTSNYESTPRLRIGGFSPDTKYTLTVVKDGTIVDISEALSDKNGFINNGESFGGSCYLSYEKISEE